MSGDNGQAQGRQEAAVDLDNLLDGDATATGSDIAPGTYPGVLRGFSKPFLLTSQFGTTTNFELQFVIRNKEGEPATVDYLCSVPENGPGNINIRSNLYKALKGLSGESFDKKGKFMKGVKLRSFVGKRAMVIVEKNDKDFPKIVAIAPEMDGLKYPTKKEIEALIGGDVPF